ncbi:hypothetical protein Bca52824_096782 [Brassica carinata]|uniref:F-box protein At3g26010-like beta-propeller domain-containing protein n=1 Tax=Brassica carinata TaxID=52824 RepID=A0A8X7TI92_BRACI|nr:hypothetical protein Bca52824_096782 [Brassica carinata]
MGMYEWRVYVYSSRQVMEFQRLLSSIPVQYTAYYPPVNVNGMLYRWERIVDDSAPGSLLAYDFFGPEDDVRFQVIRLPLPYNEDVRRCLTTSRRGDVIYIENIEMLQGRLKVWKMNKNKTIRVVVVNGGTCREEINLASLWDLILIVFPWPLIRLMLRSSICGVFNTAVWCQVTCRRKSLLFIKSQRIGVIGKALMHTILKGI